MPHQTIQDLKYALEEYVGAPSYYQDILIGDNLFGNDQSIEDAGQEIDLIQRAVCQGNLLNEMWSEFLRAKDPFF